MNSTAFSPNPAHEHFAELSAIPVESLTAALESRLRARHGAPAGFHLNLTASDITDMLADPDWSGEWDGPTIQLDDSKITTGWNPDTGIYFFIDHADDDPWPISHAGVLGAAIQSLATGFSPDCDAPTVAAKVPSAPATGPIDCETWCEDGTGHSNETLRDDQICWTSGITVLLSTHNSQRPLDEPDQIELFMHRDDGTGELVIGFDASSVARIDPEFTKAEWDQFVRSGNELWEAAK